MGQKLHTFIVLAHTHKYTQEVTAKEKQGWKGMEIESCEIEVDD